MPRRCHAVLFYTRDLRKVRSFYMEVLGLAIAKEVEGESVAFDGKGMLITFEERYLQPPSLATLFLIIEDIPHFCKRLRLQGHPIQEEWRDKAEVVDPEGRIVVLMEPPAE